MKKLNYLFLALFLCGCAKVAENVSPEPPQPIAKVINLDIPGYTNNHGWTIRNGIASIEVTKSGMHYLLIENNGLQVINLTADSLRVAGMKAVNIRQEWIDFYKEMLEENKDDKRNKK